MTPQNDGTAERPSPASAARPQGRPGRRAFRVGCLAVVAILTIVVAVAIGLVIGAARSDGVQAAWNNLRDRVSSTDDHDHSAEAVQQADGYWTCGMHPWVILPEPGLCPVCHMDLTPLDASKLRGEITIDPVVVQNIGVRIAPVTSGEVVRTIRTVGMVRHAESLVVEVNPRYAGWVEELYADYKGQHVMAGQPLFEVFSPELYAATQELMIADGDPVLVAATRERLANLGISEHDIRELETSNKPSRRVTIHSPTTGHVVDKNIFEGMYIEPGAMLYRIADHRRVWIDISVYEHQIPFAREGMAAKVTVSAVPGRVFEAAVIYVAPHLDMRTRQLTVRVEVPTPEHELKPGMFATVELHNALASEGTLAPRAAVIDTGERQVAFVSLGDGRFEPREVHMGVEIEGGLVEILDGLKEGEMVVTSGQFLLDSESRMREALAKMVTGEMASEQRPDVAVAEASGSASLLPEGRAALQQLLKNYLAIGEALASDVTSGVNEGATTIAEAIQQLASATPPGDPHFWHERQEDVKTIREQASRLANAADVETARNAYGHLSDALDRIVAATGIPPALGMTIDRRVCGMAPDVPRAGVWLQPAGEDIRNPYMGQMMLRCNLPDQHRRLPIMDGEPADDDSVADEGSLP